MQKLTNIATLVTGSPIGRIIESSNVNSPVYDFYQQHELEADLFSMEIVNAEKKSIRTDNAVQQVESGDVVFSLISGKASIVTERHAGNIITQNFVKITPKPTLDSKYLVFLLNEDAYIQKQFLKSVQGSNQMKYTVKQLKALNLPSLSHLDNQQNIGEIYFKQLKWEMLMKKVAENETKIIIQQLKGQTHHE